MKARNIKLVTPCGFVKIGHVAILCRGWTIVTTNHKFAEVTTALKPIDRLIGVQEFVELTGSTVESNNKRVSPKRKSKSSVKQQTEVLNLINE